MEIRPLLDHERAKLEQLMADARAAERHGPRAHREAIERIARWHVSRGATKYEPLAWPYGTGGGPV